MLPNLEEFKNPPFYHEMILVEGGTFMMGSEEPTAEEDERPIHEVRLNGFLLAKYPVTQSLWDMVIDNNPSYFFDSQGPVETVTWEDAQAFIERFNEMTGGHYRLPTEAEWEYAARGGNKSQGHKFAGSDDMNESGWHVENSDQETKAVGLKKSNELGLCDMCGNVWEWCQDQWHDSYEGAPNDGSAWEGLPKGTGRLRRGGSFGTRAEDCRPSFRFHTEPDDCGLALGFRLAHSWPD